MPMPSKKHCFYVTASPRATVLALATLVLAGCGLTGPIGSVTHAAGHVTHSVNGNQRVIHKLTRALAASQGKTFAARYETTGGSPATVVYAAKPPATAAFTLTPASASATRTYAVVDGDGEFYCTAPSAGAQWSCHKLDGVDGVLQNAAFDVYTPSHWTAFLQLASMAGGAVGQHITGSTMTVNGFPLTCADYRPTSTSSTNTVCVTSQGVLGYVKVAVGSSSFEIRSYTASPPASLFAVPPGAKVTGV
jgi:hypothetical protein